MKEIKQLQTTSNHFKQHQTIINKKQNYNENFRVYLELLQRL